MIIMCEVMVVRIDVFFKIESVYVFVIIRVIILRVYDFFVIVIFNFDL